MNFLDPWKELTVVFPPKTSDRELIRRLMFLSAWTQLQRAGWSGKTAARILNQSHTTLYRWAVRYRDGGAVALARK